MNCISGTPDVLKLSDWLNLFACCRAQRGAWEAGDMQSRGAGGLDGSRKHGGGIQMEVWAGTEPHLKHVLHARDAGGVEAQRLVECLRVLPSAKAGMGSGRYAAPGDGRAWGRWPK